MNKHTEHLQAILEAATAAAKANPTSSNITAVEKARRALDQYQNAPEDSDRLRTLSEVSRLVLQMGYLVSDRTIRNHSRQPGFPHKQKDGSYIRQQIEEYAARTWENPGKGKSPDAETDHGNRLKAAMAEERELRNARLRGEMIDAAEEEARDARLWYAVRSDIENQGPRIVSELVNRIAALGLEEPVTARIAALVPELRNVYEDALAEIFDRYAQQGGIEA